MSCSTENVSVHDLVAFALRVSSAATAAVPPRQAFGQASAPGRPSCPSLPHRVDRAPGSLAAMKAQSLTIPRLVIVNQSGSSEQDCADDDTADDDNGVVSSAAAVVGSTVVTSGEGGSASVLSSDGHDLTLSFSSFSLSFFVSCSLLAPAYKSACAACTSLLLLSLSWPLASEVVTTTAATTAARTTIARTTPMVTYRLRDRFPLAAPTAGTFEGRGGGGGGGGSSDRTWLLPLLSLSESARRPSSSASDTRAWGEPSATSMVAVGEAIVRPVVFAFSADFSFLIGWRVCAGVFLLDADDADAVGRPAPATS